MKLSSRIARRRHRGRARLRIDHRELADQRAGAEDRQDALAARGRHDADLEQALLDPIAAVARIARGEQRLVGLEPMRPRGREQRGARSPAAARMSRFSGARSGFAMTSLGPAGCRRARIAHARRAKKPSPHDTGRTTE